MKKKINKVVLLFSGTVLLLFTVLMVHLVWIVRDKKQQPNATLSMARADFSGPVTAATRAVIDQKLQAQPGMRSSFWNQRDHTLVYAFDNRENNAGTIFDAAIKSEAADAERVIVTAAAAQQGCPATGTNAFYGKLMQLAEYIAR